MSGILMASAAGDGRVQFNITISAYTQNYVLNTAKVTGYVAGAMDVTLTINSGIYVGSSSTAGIALDVDTSWNAGDKITIVNNGFIVGRGGTGGNGGGYINAGINAGLSAGGPALRVQRAVSISNAGTIGGGGGGGGGGAWGGYVTIGDGGYSNGGGGGGGGQGYSGGGAGSGGGASVPGNGGSSGNPGTSSGPGTGGSGGSFASAPGGSGGTGGTLGAASGAAGGNCTTAGSNANITWISTGTRLGTIA